jgi:hypothetical protein
MELLERMPEPDAPSRPDLMGSLLCHGLAGE